MYSEKTRGGHALAGQRWFYLTVITGRPALLPEARPLRVSTQPVTTRCAGAHRGDAL